MRGSSDTTSRTLLRQGGFLACFLAFAWFFSPLALADGCFVFKWNKSIDINEPTQKAIIVYDAGREDMLLQVKYAGPLEEFGWLIPVPSLPKVEKGSMEPFYELSQLTQRHFGTTKGMVPMSAGIAGRGEEKVKVIEIKTVGAYEVAVLSAQDTGSLGRWLRTHDYSLPEGKSDIIDDYIRRGWYFIAAKIDLKKGVGFKAVTGGSPKNSEPNSRKETKSKLSSGELHPLLISFDTLECIFPLKISAVAGKPSEVSLYLLATEPLLNPFIFGKNTDKLKESRATWEAQKPRDAKARQTSMQNLRTLKLAMQMYALNRTNRTTNPKTKPEWKREDLEAMAAEGMPPAALETLDDRFYAVAEELLQCLRVTPDKIPKSMGGLPHLQNRNWYLTKQVWTFTPSEMNDLRFVPAIPALAKLLAQPAGSVAAQILAGFGSNAMPNLVAACRSTNSVERVNAVRGLEQLRDQKLIDPLAELLHDKTPQVRLHAIRAAEANWDARFTDPLVSLFRDPYTEIRQEATACLSGRESPSRTPAYLALLTDDDPNVRAQALGVAWSINRRKPPPEVQSAALGLLRDTNEDVQAHALHILWKMDHSAIPRADLMPLLHSPQPTTIVMAVRLIEGTGIVRPSMPERETSEREAALRVRRLSSTELAVLATNRLGEVRFMSLQLLERNGDAKAVELTLPLLRDANSVVRNRAFAAMRRMSGQDISEDDPGKWDQWWAVNQAMFKPKF